MAYPEEEKVGGIEAARKHSIDSINRSFYGDAYEPTTPAEKESARLVGIDQANKRQSVDSINRSFYGDDYVPSTPVERESAREEDLRRTVKLPDEDMEVEPPVGQEGVWGGIEEAGRGLVRTAQVAVPEMVGKAAEYFDPEGGSTALRDWGVDTQEGAKEWLQENPEYKQSLTARKKKQDDQFSVHGSAGEAMEMLGPSLAPTAGGAAIGGVIGGAIGTVVAPGAGTMAGAALGAKAGAWVGSAASLAAFFGSAALDTEKKVTEAQIKAGVPEAEAKQAGRIAGWKSGSIEAGGELVSKIPVFQVLRLLPNTAKKNAVLAATKVVKSPTTTIKDLLKVVGTEVATELAQGAGQQYVEADAGAGEMPTWDSTKGVIMPTILMSALTYGIAEPMGMAQRNALTKTLSDKDAPEPERIQAVNAVASTIKDEEIKALWLDHSLRQVQANAPVVLADDVYYADEEARRVTEGRPEQVQPAATHPAEQEVVGTETPVPEAAAPVTPVVAEQTPIERGNTDETGQQGVPGPTQSQAVGDVNGETAQPSGGAAEKRKGESAADEGLATRDIIAKADSRQAVLKSILDDPLKLESAAKNAGVSVEEYESSLLSKQAANARLLRVLRKQVESEETYNQPGPLDPNQYSESQAAEGGGDVIPSGLDYDGEGDVNAAERAASNDIPVEKKAEDFVQRADNVRLRKDPLSSDPRSDSHRQIEVLARETVAGNQDEAIEIAAAIRANPKLYSDKLGIHPDNVGMYAKELERQAGSSPVVAKGDKRSIMGTDSIVDDYVAGADGVNYELHKPADSKAGGGFVRAVDESGEVVSMTSYRDFDKAKAEFAKSTKAAGVKKLTGAAVTDRRLESGKSLREEWDSLDPDQQFERATKAHTEARTSHVSGGLPNKLAYAESEKRAAQVFIDVDSLKFINDKVGHQAGDELLRTVGAALTKFTQNAYHISGDEFVIQADSHEEAAKIMSQAQDALENTVLIGTKGDKTFTYNPGVSYVVGETIEGADEGLTAEKEKRQAAGKRAGRGQQPPSMVVKTAARNDRKDDGQKKPEVKKSEEDAFFGDFDPETIAAHPALKDPETIKALRQMADGAGWAEQGGGRIKWTRTGNGGARMPWVPLQEWFGRKPSGVTEKHIKEAVDRLEAGTKLTKPQREAVAFMLGELNDAKVDGLGMGDIAEQPPVDLGAMAERIGDKGEEILERGAMQGLSDEAILEQLKEHDPAVFVRKQKEDALRFSELTDEEQEAELAEPFDLAAQSEEDIKAVDATIEAQRKADADADAKHQADLERKGFVLSGSSRKVDEMEARGQSSLFSIKKAGPKNLYVSHNLTAKNIEHAQEIGGLAAPSIGIGNIDKGAMTEFGEISLIANPDLITTPGMRTFAADVYSPRHPRATNTVDHGAFGKLVEQISSSKSEHGGLHEPDLDAIASRGADELAISKAVQYEYLKSIGKAPAPKRIKLETGLRPMTKLKHISVYNLQADPKFIAMVVKYAKGDSRFFDEDGAVNPRVLSNIAYTIQDYNDSNGIDSSAMRVAVERKMRVKSVQRGFDDYVNGLAEKIISGKKLFKGYTNSGNTRYVPYHMYNILKEMTGKIRNQEGVNFGSGSLRSQFVKELKSITAVKKERDQIVSAEEFKEVKKEVDAELRGALDDLAPHYKYDANGFGYMDDATSAIAEGPRGWAEAFDINPESRKIITDLIVYLKDLPTEYFETKAQRAVGINEFVGAAVPRGTKQSVVDTLKRKGLSVRYYKNNDAADRARAIRGFKGSFFSYAGEKAKTADKGALAQAVEMQQAGADMEAIRKETGWFVGMDDKWRFEISDADMKLRDNPKATPGSPGVPPHWKLDALIDHPKLFEAYPELRSVRVETMRGSGKQGYYDSKNNTIASTKPFDKEVFIHEVQHVIQNIEKFARGGSPSKGQIASEMWETAVKEMENKYGDLPFVEKVIEDYLRGDLTQNQYENEIVGISSTTHPGGTPGYMFELYQRLAGEIEARDTESRINLDEAGRKEGEPYVSQGISQEDAIIRFGGERSQSTPSMDIESVRAELSEHFGARRISRMEASGQLHIVDSASEFPEGPNGEVAPAEAHGLKAVDNGIWINASATANTMDSLAAAVLAHEGTHASERMDGGARQVLGVNYKKLAGQMLDLYESNDEAAVAAWDRIPEGTPDEHLGSEFVAYFVEEAYSRIVAGKGDTLSLKAKGLYRRIMAAIKAWFLQSPVGKDLDFKITDELLVALVRNSIGRGTFVHQGTLLSSKYSKRKRGSTRLNRGIDRLVADAKTMDSWKDWYKTYQATLEEIFDGDADLLRKLLSATSQNSTVAANTTLALKAYDQLMTGKPFTGYLPPVIKNLDKIRDNIETGGQKINAFEKANLGDESAVVIDLHMSELFFNKKVPSKGQHAKAVETVNQVAAKLGWTPRQTQAALWAVNHVRRGTAPENVPSYEKELIKRADKIKALRAGFESGGAGAGVSGRSQAAPQYSLPSKAPVGSNAGGRSPATALDIPEESTWMDTLLYHIHDKFRPLETIQKEIGTLPEEQDAYLAETQYHGKARHRLDEFDKKHVEPLKQLMSEHSHSIEQVDDFLYARHAKEANARLRRTTAKHYLKQIIDARGNSRAAKNLQDKVDAVNRIFEQNPASLREEYLSILQEVSNPANTSTLLGDSQEADVIRRWKAFSKKPSGMTDKEAADILDASKNYATLKEIGRRVDVIATERVDNLVDGGLLTPEEALAWRGAFRHYIPLKQGGFADRPPSTGNGKSVSGKESMIRGGSTKKASDILANMLSQAEATIIRAEKNAVSQALYKMVKNNPQDTLWGVDKEHKRAAYDNHGNVVFYPDTMEADNQVKVKIDGEQHTIEVDENNATAMRMVASFKNLENQAGPIVNALSKVNRVLAYVNTSASPEFMVSNFVRDIQTAAYNLSGTEADSLRSKIIKDVPLALKGLHSAIRGEGQGDWADTYKDFSAHGGKSGWMDGYSSMEDRSKKLQADVKRLKGHTPRQVLHTVAKFIEDYNSIIENAVRVSAYKNSVDAGMSKNRAAQLAKELTVNFNRKGASGQVLNSLYLFANAGIQGSMRILRGIKHSPKLRALAGATVAAAALLSIINRELGGDDDDGEAFYDKIPSHVKERNMIFMRADGDYIKIPLPWGYNVLWTMGNAIGSGVDNARGVNPEFKLGEEGWNVISSFLGAFNPIQSGTPLQTLAPTIADPIAQIAENKSWNGNPLKPEQNPYDKTPRPEYQMFWSSARPGSKAIAETLNNLSGGDEVDPGAVNVSPEWLDVIWDSLTGSAGRFVADSVGSPIKAVMGEEVKDKEIPIYRKIAGGQSEFGNASLYRERSREVLVVKEQLAHYRGNREKIAEIKRDKSELIKMQSLTSMHEKRLRRLSKRLKRASTDEQRNSIKVSMQKIYTKYNIEYRSTVLHHS